MLEKCQNDMENTWQIVKNIIQKIKENNILIFKLYNTTPK